MDKRLPAGTSQRVASPPAGGRHGGPKGLAEVLLLAFCFPPATIAGKFRTLRFARYLTARLSASRRTLDSLVEDRPS
jgi:hypothetical protein